MSQEQNIINTYQYQTFLIKKKINMSFYEFTILKTNKITLAFKI